MNFFEHLDGVRKACCPNTSAIAFGLTFTLLTCSSNLTMGKSDKANFFSVKNSANSPFGVQADIKINGKIVDENNEPLIGVNVKVKGITRGASTDVNGNFSLTVPENAVLLISYLGYKTVEVAVKGQTSLTIKLEPSGQSLKEVVVVGYGTQRKADVTGSVVSANIEAFKEAPNTNIAQSLQGVAPGLNVGQVNRAGQTPDIQVRGANTINGNTNILIVLDGIIYNGDLASINPDDIAAIDVLKDASSTAIYGAQAANGVLQITTRKGKAGKTRIAYTGAYTNQTPTVDLRPLNREEFLEKVRDLNYRDAFLAPDYTTPNPAYDVWSDISGVFPSDADIRNNDFNWWKEGTKNGHIQEHQVSVSGGAEKLNYLLSAGITDQEGFIINDKFKRNSIRLNVENQAFSWLKLGVQSFASFVNQDGDEPTLNSLIRHAPLVVPFDANGELIPSPTGTVLDNPFMTYYVDDYDRRNTFFGNFYSEVGFPFLKGLTYRLNFGNNYRVEKMFEANEYGAGLTGSASRDERSYYDYTLDNILTYNSSFAKIHNITATLLYSATERRHSRTLASATNFPSMTLGYNSLEQGINQTSTSDAWSETLNSQMGRINYKLLNRYLLTTTLRRDGFSGFAQNEKWALFPSAALGWIISEEKFFKPSWVDMLKLRASYGVNGNLIGRYSSLATFQRGRRYVFGDGASPVFGQSVASLANNNLRWEKTTGFNLGLDFNLFRSRLNGNIELYHNTTNDLLFDVSLPGVIGIDDITTNIGKLKNRGYEFSLTSQNLSSKEVTWSTTFNFSSNRNKIVSLVGLDADKNGIEDDLVQDNLFIGHSIQTIRGYQSDGIYQVEDEAPGQIPGTFKVVDQNGDGVINATDQIILGRREPSYRFSLLNTVGYKGFTFKVFLNSVQGGKNSYLAEAINPNIGSLLSDNSVRLNYFQGIDYWSPSNRDAKYPRSHLGPAQSPNIYNNRSFVRLQDVTLSYRFSNRIAQKLRLENLSLYVSGKNLATWTDWEGWDPETGQGFYDSGRPVMKAYTLGLNVTL